MSLETHQKVAIALSKLGSKHKPIRRDLTRIASAVMALRPKQRQDPFKNLEGKHRRFHPNTSKEAAYRVSQKSGTQRATVLALLVAAYPSGFTDEEIQTVTNIGANTERPRRVELVEMEWIEDSGKTRKTVAGLDAIVWTYRNVPE